MGAYVKKYKMTSIDYKTAPQRDITPTPLTQQQQKEHQKQLATQAYVPLEDSELHRAVQEYDLESRREQR